MTGNACTTDEPDLFNRENDMLKCGIAGLGAMGAGMALNLHRAGLLHRLWNRSPAKAEALARETGAGIAASPRQLARDCDLILICVSRDADVLEVIDALLPGLGGDEIVIDCSTVSVETARTAATRLGERGADFLDAPVSGGVEGARDGRLAVMAGGDPEVLERARPALRAIAANIVLMGPTGAGQATKAVNQIMAAGINQAVTEALAFGRAMGLDLARVIDVVGSGAAGNWFLDHRGPGMAEGRYVPGFRLGLHHKDLEICRQMARGIGAAELPVTEATLRDYERLMDQGHAGEDISALFRLKQALFTPLTDTD